MRGLHDTALETRNATTIPEKVVVMNDIIADKRRILAEEVGAAAEPQIFIPYKEVLDLYNAGVQVPDDVTLIWPDDNHGNMRQLPTAAERQRSGGNGLYYHISYWGAPKSYLWLDTTAPAKIWQLFRETYLERSVPLRLQGYTIDSDSSDKDRIRATVTVDGIEHEVAGEGNGPLAALVHALAAVDVDARVLDYHEHATGAGEEAQAAAYLEVAVDGKVLWGCGVSPSITTASLYALVSSINRG